MNLAAGLKFECLSAADVVALGERLAAVSPAGIIVGLQGELGAGKTTLARGFILASGLPAPVKSPTFTLVEPYLGHAGRIFHIDLYRIADPQELEAAGLRDYFDSDAICLIEWPERAPAVFAKVDIMIKIEIAGAGRHVAVAALSQRGSIVLDALA